MKFRQILEDVNEIKQSSFHLDKIQQKELNLDMNLDEQIQLKSIYEFSQRNALLAHEMTLQSNYFVPINQNASLKQSRQLQAQSYRVARPFFTNPSFQQCEKKQKVNFNFGQSINHMSINHHEYERQMLYQKNRSQPQSLKQYQQKRISIFLQQQRQKQQSSYFSKLKNGLIPLRTAIKPQSLVINTYRQLKNRFENYEYGRQQKQKNKVQIKKDENNRFKGTPFTYDYNGEPIPLKNYKQSQPKNNAAQKNTPQSITIIPLAQNIILPSTINKKRLQKRKARYLKQDQQKQNNRNSYQDQKFIYYDGSQFIKKTPIDINKSKLFNKEKQQQNYKKSPEQITFSEFKKNLDQMRVLNVNQFQPKSQKVKLSNLSDIKQEVKVKKSFHKINFSQGKVIMNQKIFETVFNFKPKQSYEQQIESQTNNQFKEQKSTKSVKKRQLHPTFQQGIIQVNNFKQRHSKHSSMHSSTVNNLCKMSKSFRKQVSKSFNSSMNGQQKTSIFRSSLKGSPKKNGNNSNHSGHDDCFGINRYGQKQASSKLKQKYQQSSKSTNKIGSTFKNDLMTRKRKLKTRPSCKYFQNA